METNSVTRCILMPGLAEKAADYTESNEFLNETIY